MDVGSWLRATLVGLENKKRSVAGSSAEVIVVIIIIIIITMINNINIDGLIGTQ